MASPVFERRRLYFRDGTGLWCIEKPAGDNLAGASRASASGGAEQPTAQDAGGPAHSASDACGQAIDDGPDLADSAKTAPVLSLHEWLFEYDATRDRIRRVSLIVEWTLALSALAWGGWELRRSRTKPGWAWLAVLVAALALATPCLAYQDRLGNAYHPVLAWCLAGALLSWVWGNSPTEARPRAWSPAPPPKTRPHAVRTLSGLTWGLVLGGMAGLLAHHLPAQLALMAYILMGWQRV
jgi:hypothetical protein